MKVKNLPQLIICVDMEQFFFENVSLYNNLRLKNQAVIKQEHPKHQAEKKTHLPTWLVWEEKNKTKMLSAIVDSFVDEGLSYPSTKFSKLYTLLLAGVEPRV